MEKKINHYCLAWLDLEMTGLNPEHDRILEMALIITDAHLNVLTQSEVLVIHQSDDLLNNMDEWNTQTHGRTGLTERSRASDLDEATAENQMLELLRQWVPEKTTPLCGNSVHQDRRFLAKYMPQLESYFHYRNVDVSTLKELARRWNPEIYRGVKKRGAHQALDDIMESIEEMRYYRDHFLILPDTYQTNQAT
ncbi:MAG: oligoribonuclease [Neisseriaceae bacterium]|nr:oligoribonuclease [Neisseriaceae bacterium]